MNTWSIEKADQVFSGLILKRDPMCVRCRMKPSTDCSHFYKRDCSGTRYDPRNGDGVDRECHWYWEEHREEYEKFKRKQLGWRVFVEISRLASAMVPRESAIIRFMKTQGEKAN